MVVFEAFLGKIELGTLEGHSKWLQKTRMPAVFLT